MQKLVPFALFSLLLFSQNTFAQKKWTVRECIEHALNNNLQLKLANLTVNLQETSLKQAQFNRLPSLNGQMSHSYNYGRSIDPFTNQFINQAVQSNVFGASADLTIFNGFSLTNSIKQAQTDLNAAQFDSEKSKNDMILAIFNASLQIFLNKELLDNAKTQAKTLEEQVLRTEKLVKAGSVAEGILYDLLSQKSSADLQIVNSENALMLSKLNLAQLLMLPAGEDFDVSVPTMPEISDAKLAAPALIYETAQSNMPEVKSADLRIKSAQLGIKIAAANFYPRISLSGSLFTNYSSAQTKYFKADGTTSIVNREIGYLKSDPTQIVLQPVSVPGGEISDFNYSKQLRESFRQSWGVTMTIPIFNKFQVRNAVKNADLQMKRAELNALTVKNQLRQTIEQAYTEARAAFAGFQANQKRLDAVLLSKENAEKRFSAGVMNTTDFNIALNNYNAALSDLTRAKYQYIFRVKVLDFYQGKEVDF